MNDNRKTVIVAALAALLVACVAVAQTHYNLTNNQNFTVANGKSLTGTYQCSGAGTIQDCALSGVTLTSPTITGGTWTSGTFGRQTTPGDGLFTCAGSNTGGVPSNACNFSGSYEFSSPTTFDSGFSTSGTNNFASGTTTISNTATLSISGTLLVNTLSTLSATKTVRAGGGAADCTLTFTRGLLTGTTCS